MRAAALALLAHCGRIVLGLLVIAAAVVSLLGCVAGLALYAAYVMEPEAAQQGVQQVLGLPRARMVALAAGFCVALSASWLCWMVGDETVSTLSRCCRTVAGDRRGIARRAIEGTTRFLWTSAMGAVSVAMGAVGIAALVVGVSAVGLLAFAPSAWSTVAAALAQAGVTTGDVIFAVSTATLCAAWFLWSVGMDVTDR